MFTKKKISFKFNYAFNCINLVKSEKESQLE